MRQFQQVVDRLGVLQIDSVNVLARAHLLPAFSRIGAYDPALLDRASGRGAAPARRDVGAHGVVRAAGDVPAARLAAARLPGRRRGARSRRCPLQHSPLVEEIRAIIAERGPVTARQVQEDFEADHPTTRGEWGWNWSVAKRVLEFLFFTGEITSAGPQRRVRAPLRPDQRACCPPDVLARPEPSDEDAVRALTEIGARAHGIGTLRSIADYFRIKEARVAPRDRRPGRGGRAAARSSVDGWNQGPVWRHRDATLPRRATGRALLNPFDPLVFERRRLEALFGLRYRIEIYVPEPKRVWGYYVLPFLLGESLPALVDLKADRQAGVLRVQAAHRATGSSVPDADVVEPLAAELRELAGWLGLDDIVVGDRDGLLRGDLAPDLALAVRSA